MIYPKTENLYASNGAQDSTRARGPEFGGAAAMALERDAACVTCGCPQEDHPGFLAIGPCDEYRSAASVRTCLRCGNRSVVPHGGGWRCRDCGADEPDSHDDEAIAREVAERDANDTGERVTVEELAESVGLPVPPSDAASVRGFWRYAGSKTAICGAERYCAISGDRIKVEVGARIPSGCDCDGTVHPVSVWPPAQNGRWF